MSEVVATREIDWTPTADTALKAAAGFWFFVTVIGQWVFVAYIVGVFGPPAFRGDFEAWNSRLPHGIVAGDSMGNFAVALHLALAAVITFCGPLQLVPQIRAVAPALHRWSGRIYILTAFAISIDGLYMVLTRGVVGGVLQHVSISLNAILIMICAALALRHAFARRFPTHRRWALRLFMVVSGVWFFRIGMMFWVLVNRGPVGFDPETFQGPFISFLGFAQYLLPLAVLEIYLRTKERAGAAGRIAVAAGLFALTVAMGVGVFGAVVGMWLPHLQQ